jgi:type IV pilus assembly protein PilQ
MVSTSQEEGRLVVSLAVTGPVEYKKFTLKDPTRLVVDLFNVECKVPFNDLQVNAGKVRQIRVGQSKGDGAKVSRLVFDLEEGYGKPEIYKDDETINIIFPPGDVAGNASLPKAAVKPPPPVTKPQTEKVPSVAGQPKALPGASRSAATVTPPKPSVDVAPAPPAPVKSVSTPSKSAPSQPTSGAKAVAAKSVGHSPTVAAGSETPKTSKGSAPSTSASSASVEKVNPPPKKSVEAEEISGEARVTTKVPPHVPPVEQPAPAPPQPAPAPATMAPAPQQTPPPAPAAVPQPAPAPAPVAGQESGRFSGTPLTLDLVDIPLVDFFRLMAEEGGVNIVMDPGIKGNISIKVVKVPWDQIFEAALGNNNLDKQVEGNLIRIALKSTLQDEAKQRESLKKANVLAADVETKIKRLNYAKASALIDPLADQKSVRGTVVVDERTNSLVITDIPSHIQKMLSLIETLDVAQPQVEIEARIVSATRDFARDIGVQFGFVQGNLQRVTVGGPNTFGTIGGTRPSATPTSTFAAGNPLTGRGASESTSSQSGGTSTGTGTGPPAGNWNLNLPASKAFGGLGISVGNIFDTFLLDAAITAGETKGLAKMISQPKTVAQNNSPAMITQGLRFPVQIIANNTISVQFQNAALTLTVVPQITLEGNIILDLSVENNTADFSRQVNGIPSIRTSESKTRVLVSDGGTTVIGGILIDDETTQDDRIPGLGSLPVIGNLFRRNSVSHSTQEVLFFVTPKIIK